MQSISFQVEQVLAAAPERLPLIQTTLRPNEQARNFQARDATVLFPNARYGPAALAGLLLRAGCWPESHNVAQDIDSAEGSYWHAIIHRMEPDSFNAGYWFRHVGKHPIFPELLRRTTEILADGGPKYWQVKNTWDAFLFVEWCDEAREKGGQAEASAIEIQMTEWQLLFDWCVAN